MTEEEEQDDEDEVAELVMAVGEQDWARVRRLISENPDRVYFNASRKSVQVRSQCRPEMVVANVDVPLNQVEFLSAATSDSTWRRWWADLGAMVSGTLAGIRGALVL